MHVITGIITLKFLIPAMMLWWPGAMIWSNYILDTIDGDILGALGLGDSVYQVVDKGADYWSYICMAIVASRWKVKKLVYILFAYRSIGQALYFATHNELVLFYFQNLLEPFLLVYTFLMWRAKGESGAYGMYQKHKIPIWVGIIAYKMWNEWYLHFANIDLSTLLFGVSGN